LLILLILLFVLISLILPSKVTFAITLDNTKHSAGNNNGLLFLECAPCNGSDKSNINGLVGNFEFVLGLGSDKAFGASFGGSGLSNVIAGYGALNVTGSGVIGGFGISVSGFGLSNVTGGSGVLNLMSGGLTTSEVSSQGRAGAGGVDSPPTSTSPLWGTSWSAQPPLTAKVA
jgi:hypothetical protein